jgi:hypothetical protein
MAVFFVGYVIVLIGVVAGLWRAGILDRVGGTWTGIGVLIALGLGIMFAVSAGGTKQTIDIERR